MAACAASIRLVRRPGRTPAERPQPVEADRFFQYLERSQFGYSLPGLLSLGQADDAGSDRDAATYCFSDVRAGLSPRVTAGDRRVLGAITGVPAHRQRHPRQPEQLAHYGADMDKVRVDLSLKPEAECRAGQPREGWMQGRLTADKHHLSAAQPGRLPDHVLPVAGRHGAVAKAGAGAA